MAYLDERQIYFDSKCFGIPERLLIEHARGKVLFIAGAGVSYRKPSQLPDFRELTKQAYRKLDPQLFKWVEKYDNRPEVEINDQPNYADLDVKQQVEAGYFVAGKYDIALGILERRMDGEGHHNSQLRRVVIELLGRDVPSNSVHESLLKLSDRGGATALITTNFDRLFQKAARKAKLEVPSYSLGAIPRPDKRASFHGLFHIHGLLESDVNKTPDLILTEQDFGEYYLRRRVASDFLYDALRIFNLVFVGYSLGDPPMQYVMSAVSADERRYSDLGKRYILLGQKENNPVAKEDWSSRGFIPVFYDNADGHQALGHTLSTWARFSPINGDPPFPSARFRNLLSAPRANSSESDRDLFDHLYRRGGSIERTELIKHLKAADLSWLTATNDIQREARAS
jgi:hypothetical protein